MALPRRRRHELTLLVVCAGWGTIPLLARHVDLPPAAVVFARVWVAVPLLATAVAVDRRRGRSARASAAPDDPGAFRAPGAATTGTSAANAPGAPTTGTSAPDAPGARTKGTSAPDAPGAPTTSTTTSTASTTAVPRWSALLAGALLAVHWTAIFAGYQHAPADSVVFVVFLAPVGIAALAPLLLGERLDRRTLAALALAVGGFALVAGPALEPGTSVGLAWAALSAVTFVGLVLVSKALAPRLGGLRLNLVEMAVAGVLLLPLALTADWTGFGDAWPWLVVLGAVHTALGITLYLAALAVVPATHVGILGYVEPVSVVVLSWLVLGDRPALTTVLGGALVIAAGVLVVRQTAREATDGAPVPLTAPEVPARVPG